jgi:hypothetical protein
MDQAYEIIARKKDELSSFLKHFLVESGQLPEIRKLPLPFSMS